MTRTRRSIWLVMILSVALLVASTHTAAQRGGRIRIGSIAPTGSLWDDTLNFLAQDWREVSDGSVRVTIYPDGNMGDETEMVRKVRQGQLQGVLLSSVGMSRIDSSVACLQVPMLLDSYAELDYVRDQMAETLEARIEAKGFKVLNWGDAGWVRVFSKDQASTPDDLKEMKLFTSAGDPETETLYKQFGFQVVPLSLVDLVTSLQTGMIDAVPLPPLFAQLQELHKLTPHMLNVPLTPLVGGTVISMRAWRGLPEQHRDAMLRSARQAGDQLRTQIREFGEDTIVEMSKRGLKVTEPDAGTLAAWQREASSTYKSLRGDYCPADVFDEVVRLRDEYRASL